MNKIKNLFSCKEIETIVGESTVTGDGVVETNGMKWTFVLPLGTEIKADISKEGGSISFSNCSQ